MPDLHRWVLPGTELVPGCVLHVSGDFDVDAALAATRLEPYMVWRKGEIPKRGRRLPNEGSGFCLSVSEEGVLEAQAESVVRFLETHKDDLATILALDGVVHPHLDFGYDCRLHAEGTLMQGDYLPARLLALCGDLGLAIMLSLYPANS